MEVKSTTLEINGMMVVNMSVNVLMVCLDSTDVAKGT